MIREITQANTEFSTFDMVNKNFLNFHTDLRLFTFSCVRWKLKFFFKLNAYFERIFKSVPHKDYHNVYLYEKINILYNIKKYILYIFCFYRKYFLITKDQYTDFKAITKKC